MFNYLKYEEVDGQIAIVTINRPEALNALNGDVVAELDQMIDQLQEKKDLRVVILTGEGRSFVAGADIGVQSVFDYDAALNWGETGCRVFKKWEDIV